MRTYNIGQLAKDIELSIDTLRYYEDLGLVEKPLRLPNGYRNYTLEIKNRFLFIKWAKTIGFTLKEIKEMLDIKHASSDTCEAIKIQAVGKIELIDKKILELKKLRKSLKEIVLVCEKTPGEDCPILEDFEQCK
jgi:MerR family mercuric resistance operon transcriptional regulator